MNKQFANNLQSQLNECHIWQKFQLQTYLELWNNLIMICSSQYSQTPASTINCYVLFTWNSKRIEAILLSLIFSFHVFKFSTIVYNVNSFEWHKNNIECIFFRLNCHLMQTTKALRHRWNGRKKEKKNNGKILLPCTTDLIRELLYSSFANLMLASQTNMFPSQIPFHDYVVQKIHPLVTFLCYSNMNEIQTGDFLKLLVESLLRVNAWTFKCVWTLKHCTSFVSVLCCSVSCKLVDFK